MKATLHTNTFHMELIEKPIPALEDGEALLKVKACGFCGSDKHDLASPPKSPNTPGHEFSGIVEDIRGNGQGFFPGDRVVVSPKIVCHECPSCLRGEIDYCERVRVYGCRGAHHPPGGFAEYVKVKVENLLRIPEKVSFEEAAMADPVAVAIHSLDLAPAIEGKHVAIFGAGTIGLVAAQIARFRKARKVFLVDISSRHLEIGKSLGDFETLLAQKDGSHLEVLKGAEIDLSLELAGGEAPTLGHAIETTRRGGTVLLISQRPGGAKIDYQHVIFWEQRLQGVFGYRDPNFLEALTMMEKKQVQLEPLITGRYPLESANVALKAALEGDSVKVEIFPNPD